MQNNEVYFLSKTISVRFKLINNINFTQKYLERNKLIIYLIIGNYYSVIYVLIITVFNVMNRIHGQSIKY